MNIYTISKFDKFLIILILISFPIQSFVISNVVKGLTPFNVLMIFSSFYFFIKFDEFRKSIILFILLFSSYFFLQEIFNSLYILGYKNPYAPFIETISSEIYYKNVIRKSFFTQSIYLVISVSFFLIILLFLKRLGRTFILRITIISILIFTIYGWYEFFFFLITHQNPDFISNRITGENFRYGLFQTLTIGPIEIQRIKSLAGEPSMFAYTIMPFFVILYYLKHRFLAILLFLSLLISTSTTAIAGIFFFTIIDLIFFKKNRLKKILFYFLLSVILYLAFKPYIDFLIEFTLSKITLKEMSGLVRFFEFYVHFNAWFHSDIFHILFGYGWGYVRSTDGLTTLLFNVGLVGFILFSLLNLYPYFKIRKKTFYIKALFIAIIVNYLLILISVPEFYYPHTWILVALLWYELFRKS